MIEMKEIETSNTIDHELIFIISLFTFTKLVTEIMIIMVSIRLCFRVELTTMIAITSEIPFNPDLKCMMVEMAFQITS